MTTHDPRTIIAEWRQAGPGKRRGILCILAAVVTGILGLVFVEDGSLAVVGVAAVIVGLIVAAIAFHMRDERAR